VVPNRADQPLHGSESSANADAPTVSGFGDEWSAFDQSGLGEAESAEIFGRYFSVVDGLNSWRPEHALDVGCGSGRWARHVAPLVGSLTAVDASPAALDVARRNLATFPNVTCAEASVAALPVADDSQDLVYSLGVLHHVPDTAAAVRSCAAKVKPGGRLLLYLYYRFDDRPRWFRLLWRLSDVGRRLIARLPFSSGEAAT
jgi:SAM-dependent methyltransferase